VFLNYQGEPISERGIRKLVVKYRKEAGITKKASCHTLRHTFATYKAEKGVSAYQLQQWLGHADLNTTQIYVHSIGIFIFCDCYISSYCGCGGMPYER
jgi:site-specific recombinase XerD